MTMKVRLTPKGNGKPVSKMKLMPRGAKPAPKYKPTSRKRIASKPKKYG